MTKIELIRELQSMTELPDDAEVVMFSMYHRPTENNCETIVSVNMGYSQAYEGKIIIRNYEPPEIVKNNGKPAPNEDWDYSLHDGFSNVNNNEDE